MIKIYNQIKLDVSRSNEFSTVFSKQGDQNSRFIIASICLDGNFICMPKNASVKLHVIRPDKVGASFDGLVMDDGRVIVPLDRWISSVAGDSRCSVEISCDEQVLTTMKFTVTTEESDDVNDIGSPDITPTDPEYDAVLELINDYKNGRLVGADGAGIDRIELMATDTDSEGRTQKHYDVYSTEGFAIGSFTVTDGKDGAQGERGEKGEKGANGLTPHIGENGNWWIGNTDTGINPSGVGFPYARYAIPTLYFEGDISAMTKENAVTLNYVYGERSGTCTLKWQGNSSLEFPKKNYTVKFDNAFEAKEGWGEQKKYCLKADWVDFSHCRNVVSAKVWGDVVRSRATSELVTRLSALPNCGAIDGFPCFVIINGEWMGVYNFNIPKDGWMFGMVSGADRVETVNLYGSSIDGSYTDIPQGATRVYVGGSASAQEKAYLVLLDENGNVLNDYYLVETSDSSNYDISLDINLAEYPNAVGCAVSSSYSIHNISGGINYGITLEFTIPTVTKEAILCAEGTLARFGELFLGEAVIGTHFSNEYSSDGWTESEIQASLNRLINAVISSDGSDIDTTVAQYLDIDSAIDYINYVRLLHHSDGISKNYVLATYDGVKWFFSAYDLDGVFGNAPLANIFHSANRDILPSLRMHKLFNLLWVHKQREIVARCRELVGGALSKANVDEKFTNYASNIPLLAYNADATLWKGVPNTSVNNIDQIMNWYDERVKCCEDEHLFWEYNIGTKGIKYTDNSVNGMGTCIETDVKIAQLNPKTRAYIYFVSVSAFKNETSLERIVLSTHTRDIYNEAFKGCTSLKEVVFPNTINLMANNVFQDCTALKTVVLPSFTSGAWWGTDTFNGCTSLAKVVIPADIPYIPIGTFCNCQSLKDIFYGGTMAEWNALEKGDVWDHNTGEYTVHCSDGDIAKGDDNGGDSGPIATKTITSPGLVQCSGMGATTVEVNGTCSGYMSGGRVAFVFTDVDKKIIFVEEISRNSDSDMFDVNKTYTIPEGAEYCGAYTNTGNTPYLNETINEGNNYGYDCNLTLTFS